ncbi:MAG TPA: ABC transporter substrate-binding protein, partial [Herpetosiphonaceae bacterium]|nr:ABC transporter substrate-binding protein [Herpetosiphonaceae bacterium]
MKHRIRIPFAWLLLITLILPLLAACGGTPPAGTTETTGPAAATTEAPAATVGDAVATEAPAEVATMAPAETAADAATAEATEAPAEVTEAPAGAAVDVNPDYLVFGGSGEPDTLDSMNTTAGTALVVSQQMLERLAGFTPGGFDIVPGLATEWSANEDSTEWTFKLRENVQFHDGTPFNAEAVVFNFTRLADPNFEFGFRAVNEGDPGNTFPIFPDIFGGFIGDPNTLWEGIEAVDENTVKINLTKPVPILPSLLAASYFGISSPEAVKKGGLQYGSPEVGVVGTGPFIFEEWRAGESVSAKRNEDYWGEKAKMPGVAFRFIADQAQRQAELENGSIDFTINLSADARETIEANQDLKVVSPEPFNVAYLSLDMTAKPLDDVRVRQAIAYALNKQEILDGLYGGVGEVADDFLPDALAWARPTTLEPYAYDPEKAKALLAEAGYPDGFSTVTLADGSEIPLELWYMPVARPYNPVGQAMGEAMA